MDITVNNTNEMITALTLATTKVVEEVTLDVYAEERAQLQQLIYDTPESPNYKRTHNLFNSVRHETTGLIGTVTAGGKFDVGYAMFVHEGTTHMTARPYAANAINVVMTSFYKNAPVAANLYFRSIR